MLYWYLFFDNFKDAIMPIAIIAMESRIKGIIKPGRMASKTIYMIIAANIKNIANITFTRLDSKNINNLNIYINIMIFLGLSMADHGNQFSKTGIYDRNKGWEGKQ